MSTDHLLSPEVTAHCFFGCGHTVTDRPDAAHDGMERHYAAQHQADIDRLNEAFRRMRSDR